MGCRVSRNLAGQGPGAVWEESVNPWPGRVSVEQVLCVLADRFPLVITSLHHLSRPLP